MSDIKRVGFIGLGIMGRPMALNLLKAGFELTVWNRSRPGIEALLSAGAAEAANPREVAERTDAVITVVGYAEDVEQVALGPSGIIEGAHEGLIHIDMSTIAPDVTRRISSTLAERGVAMLDAPISGGEPGAIAGRCRSWLAARRPCSSSAARCSRRWARRSSTAAQVAAARS